jgi:hypothetical protein
VARYEPIGTGQIDGKAAIRGRARGQPDVVREFFNLAIQRVDL